MQNRSFSLIDTTGRFLFSAEFDQIGRWGNGMAPVLVGSAAGTRYSPAPIKPTESLGGKWGFINRKGKIVVNPVYQGVKGFSEGFAAVKSGGLWAYIDSDFNWITGYEFRWVDYFHNGIAEVRLGPVHGDYDGRYAFINSEGDVIWEGKIRAQPIRASSISHDHQWNGIRVAEHARACYPVTMQKDQSVPERQ